VIGSKMNMKKIILVGALLAVFLLLMAPVDSAVKSNIIENNQTRNKENIVERQIINKLLLLLPYIKLTNPEQYNKINDEIIKYKNGTTDTICAFLLILWLICMAFSLMGSNAIQLLLWIIVSITAEEINCKWFYRW
jgi:hypothetical protein